MSSLRLSTGIDTSSMGQVKLRLAGSIGSFNLFSTDTHQKIVQ